MTTAYPARQLTGKTKVCRFALYMTILCGEPGAEQHSYKSHLYRGFSQGRSRVKSYKVHEIEAVPEEWVRVADTHEAIIDQKPLIRYRPFYSGIPVLLHERPELHLFSGFLKCADCGRAITTEREQQNVYYACSTYKIPLPDSLHHALNQA